MCLATSELQRFAVPKHNTFKGLKMKYLLSAYKPDSHDYCRGCHMASYSSDFQQLETDDKSELIDFWADLLAKELGYNEEGYQFTLHGDYMKDEFDDFYDLEKEAQAQAKHLIAKREEAKRLEEQAKKERERQKQVERDLAQLAELQKKYGGQ
jgi:hypothetical protein